MEIYTIIFLALAVFIFLRLRNVLGQRTGNERPPYDRPARNVVQGAQDNNNVVPLPGAVIEDNCVVCSSIIGPDAVIGEASELGATCVVGAKERVAPSSRLSGDVRLGGV